MHTRLLCIFALFAYINTLFYEDGHVHPHPHQIIDGAPLIEIILEDVLDLPCKDIQDNQAFSDDFQYDDYRPASSKWSLIALVERINAEFTTPRSLDVFQHLSRLSLNTKTAYLLGYYRFLFRLNPF